VNGQENRSSCTDSPTAGPYRSIDGGVTWTPASAGLSSAAVLVFAVARGTRTIYAGTNVGIFSSDNNGASWETVGAGLTNLTINAMTFDPTGNLYVGTNGGGIFRLALQSADREAVVLPPARVGQGRRLEFRR